MITIWLIKLIGVMVPSRLRADWRQEWEAELRHREALLAEWDNLNWRTKLDLLRRSLGAFRDALLLQPRRLEDEMFQDVRYGIRMLIKRPGFTLVAVVTLALGIGANTVIFSGVYSLLFQPLPYPGADRMVVIFQTDRQGNNSGISYPDFDDWKKQNTSFEQMAIFRTATVNLGDGNAADNNPAGRVTGAYVSKEFLPLMGGRAVTGRTLASEDFRPGGAKTLILSYGLWQFRFGGDEKVVGKEVRLGDERFTVIGVLQQSFQYPLRAAFWTALEPNEQPELLQDRAATDYQAIAVLKPVTPAERAVKELSMMASRSAQSMIRDQDEFRLRVAGLRESMTAVAKYRTPALVFQLAVLFVLLIASVNLANMLLARNTEREREFTIRLALGAGPLRIVRQLLAESLLIGLSGCLLGLLFSVWGMNGLRAILPSRLLITGLGILEINTPVLLFTLLLSLFTSLCFGLVPAIISSRLDLNEGLKTGASHTGIDPRRKRFCKILVSAEVALAVALLAASGLMIRTFLNLTVEDPGFDPHNSIAISPSLPRSYQTNHSLLSSYFNDATARLKSIPGVEAVGGATYLPLIGYNPGISFRIEGRLTESPETALRADFQPILPDYFRAMKIPLIGGRPFADADLKPVPDSVIINHALAKKFWPGEDPLGKQIRLHSENGLNTPLTIIGIVGDVKQFGLHNDPRPEIYLPAYHHSMKLIVRTTVNPGNLFRTIRETLPRLDHELDDQRAALSLKTMDQVMIDSIASRRAFAILLGTLAVLALILATMGIYGVISYLSAQRTHEVGIRLALGARPSHILALIVGQGMRPVLYGLFMGSIAATALTRVMKSLLFGVSHTDPLTFAVTMILLLAISTLACLFPARRMMRVDPVAALKYD